MSSTDVPSTEVAEVIIDLGHSEPTPTKGVREWVYTINNYSEDDVDMVRNAMCRYHVWAPEVGAKGTPHIQGYIVFKDAKTRSAVSKILPRAWLAPRSPKSTPEQCRNYIVGPYSKKGKDKPANPNAVEVGTIPSQGKRNDLEDFHDAIKAGKRGRELSENHLAVRAKYPRLEQTLVNEEDEQRAIDMFKSGAKPEVHVRWGAPGVGKSRYIYDNHNAEDIYELNLGDGSKQSVWWDGYRGQPVILINDFEGELGWKYLLRLLDRYPFRMQVKGGHCWRLCKYLYITANCAPDQWYRTEAYQPLLRRIDSITEVV